METVAEIKHITKSFGNREVLKDIDFKMEKGENLVVFGKSGSGKSVLIKCMAGLLSPDDGEVFMLGQKIHGMKNRDLNVLRKRIGFLFQGGALYDSMTVRENLAFPLRDLKSRARDQIGALVAEALANVGLSDAIDKMPSELSGGMRKRVGLARTLILKPEIILYDEPTTGLDPITSKEISELILAIQKKYQSASVIITHDVECARITANRMIIIKDGMVVARGTYKELSGSDDSWVRSFFN
jgi:phospholipid/cholesterol/gamma-HCH transport system ATP-binding protein